MKNLKNIVQASFIALGLFFSAQIEAQVIPANFFGQNAWMPDSVGTRFLGGKLHQSWGKIQESKAGFIRFGGISPDKDSPTNYQYIKMIDSVRARGMEPIIQVSFHNGDYSAQHAAQVVQYINITKSRNIKYWVIGNEPDLEYSYTTAAQVAAYFKPFATAMKAVDPSILTIGPECAWYDQGIINGLTEPNGPSDITGKDANGNYYLDVVSFHSYPFAGAQTRGEMITKLTGANSLQSNLILLNTRIAAANTAHGRSGAAGLRTAITEANVNYKNSPSDNLNGTGVNSFIGAQFLAEMFSVGLKNSVNFMNIWSVVEGSSTELNIGYLDRTTGAKKPAFYHFQMMAQNFKGNFISGSSNQANVKAFGSQNAQQTTVMVMNQDLTSNYNFTVRLNSDVIAGSSALKINLNASINKEYSDVLPNQSTMLLTFNQQGVLIKKIIYTLATHAMANLAPTVTEFSANGQGEVATGTNDQPSDAAAVSMKGFGMNVFPNPAKSKFTVEIDRVNTQDVKFEIELYDLMGRLVHTQTSIFPDRQAKIDLADNTIAEAVYIVRVREEGDKENKNSIKVVIFK